MIIKEFRSVIPACDCDPKQFETIVKESAKIKGVGGYKIGLSLSLAIGLPKVVEIARKYTDKTLIYDHHNAGTDCPQMGESFATVCKESGIDAVVIFPQAGPESERAWVDFALSEDLGVIIGGMMSHRKYLRSDGGYIADEAIVEMYERAAALGVNDYIVPGNTPEAIKKVRAMLEREHSHPVFYSYCAVSEVEKLAAAAGESFHVIIGGGKVDVEMIAAVADKLNAC